jgi:hypothetical protein
VNAGFTAFVQLDVRALPNSMSGPYSTTTIYCVSFSYQFSYYNKAFNSDVQKMSELFSSEAFIEPFSLSSPPHGLVNFATDMGASSDTQQSLINWHGAGQRTFQNFVLKKSVCSDWASEPAQSFYDPLQRSNVKTMDRLYMSVVVWAA